MSSLSSKIAIALIFASTWSASWSSAAGQDFIFQRTQLSSTVQLAEAPNSSLAHLDRIDAFIRDRQWDEVVETLRRVALESGDKLVQIESTDDPRDNLKKHSGSQQYIPLARWCQLQLAMMSQKAPEVLRLYRTQIDPLARRWYTQAVADRDDRKLQRIVDELFCSSYGDDALYALGEIALERGQPATARAYWERISPKLRASWPAASQVGDEPDEEAFAASGVSARPLWQTHLLYPERDLAALSLNAKLSFASQAYPDTDLSLPAVRARLILASILSREPARAAFELQLLQNLHPDAQGMLNGKHVRFHDGLTALLRQSHNWQNPPSKRDWPTFAGNARRSAIAKNAVDISGEPAWSVDLGLRLAIDEQAFVSAGVGPRVGESAEGLLSYHPAVVGNVMLLNDVIISPQARDMPHAVTRVRAYDLRTGKPAWPQSLQESATDDGVVQQSRPFPVRLGDRRRWGVPRFTLSSRGKIAFARIGSPITIRPADDLPGEGRSQLIAIDLSQQGKLLWSPIDPLDESYAFEGPPVADESALYVALRRSLAQPQAHAASYDLKTGEPRWQTWVSGAESPALGRTEEVTHNLLTLHDGVVYFNTNLGCLAALRASDGKLLWVTVYPRANFNPDRNGAPATNFQRDANPCVYWKGLLFAAPSDCHNLLCVEAASGKLLWAIPATDIVHLLGVSDDGKLIASGRRLWWIDAQTGDTSARFPESPKTEPVAHGRGILAGNVVYWPTLQQLYVFDQSGAKQIRQPIDLARRGLTGGNISVAGKHLVVTTADRVVAFGE